LINLILLLGATPAQSKLAFVNWLDSIVAGIASIDPRVYDLEGMKQDGIYQGLRLEEFGSVLSLISGLYQWGTECFIGKVSCGTFYMTMTEGQEQPVTCGPFISSL